MTPSSASIIIPVYNRPEGLAHLLRQLMRQSRSDFEVVVVDDGSEPPVEYAGDAADLPYRLAIVRHECRGGVGKARNTGVNAARADLLIFVDSDGDIPDNCWFEKHLGLYNQAEVLARNAGKPYYVFHSGVEGISRGYWGHADTYSNWFGSSMTQPCEIRDRHVPTHNTSFHRKVYDFVGPFDEVLEVCEDVEWAFRCLDKGAGLFFIPGASIGHFDRNGFTELWRHYYRFGLYALKVRQKCRNSPYRWLFPKNFISAILLFFPLTILMTVYVCWCWLFRDLRVIMYLPGLYLANIASYIGVCQSLLTVKNE